MRRDHRTGRRKESGAALVEFIIVAPVLILLVFGTIEFAFILRDKVAVTNLTRDASRTASANPRLGNVSGHWGPVAPSGVSPAPIPSFAYLASTAIESSGSSLRKDSIRDFWVYLANPLGYPTQSADWQNDKSNTMTCLPKYCVRYAWKDATDGFRFDGQSTWDPQDVNACPRSFDKTGGQAVGVYLRVEHQGLYPGLFKSTLELRDRNVVKFEPMRTDSCRK